MSRITYNGNSYNSQDGESVLDCLLRSGLDMPHGCKAGSCQSCMVQVEEGDIPLAAQPGLSPAQKKLGYALACSCVPKSDLSISLPDDINQKVPAQVLEADRLNESIVRLRIKKAIDYLPGQFISIWLGESQFRSYSIASTSQENFIELHVKKIDGGAFSQPAYENLQAGDELTISGPLGHCVYASEDIDEPLLLSGIGTGLAPLYGILREALAAGHTGKIDLVLGAKDSTNFYLVGELQSLQNQHSNLSLHFIAQTNNADFAKQDDLYSYTKTLIPDTKGYRVFLCGAESFVKKMRKQCFLAGAAMDHIHADAFVASG